MANADFMSSSRIEWLRKLFRESGLDWRTLTRCSEFVKGAPTTFEISFDARYSFATKTLNAPD